MTGITACVFDRKYFNTFLYPIQYYYNKVIHAGITACVFDLEQKLKWKAHTQNDWPEQKIKSRDFISYCHSWIQNPMSLTRIQIENCIHKNKSPQY